MDAETGKELWKTYTVPAPGEPGSETWPAGGDHYKRGGGAIWVTGTYDPETNLTFWGTGNAAPWFGDQRPGDNLYTTSVDRARRQHRRRSRATSSITPTTPGTGTRSRRRSWSTISATAAP